VTVAEGVWRDVVGQDSAVAFLTAAAADPVHAYLLVGPTGTTKWEAARAFAALLVSPDGDPAGRDARLALSGDHPDVIEVRRVGAAITKDQADDIVRAAALSPLEARRKVFLLDEFHLVAPPAAATLLKTIEESPESTVFVVLADDVPPDLVTIASRCVRVDVHALRPDVIEDRLVDEGVPGDVARLAATHAGGRLDRARLLAHDPGMAARRDAFAHVPTRLDGTGAVATLVVDELLGLIDGAAEPLKERQAAERSEWEQRMERAGERATNASRRSVDDRHKREMRRHRVDELKSGLATIAETYRDRLVAGAARDPASLVAAVDDLHGAIEVLDRSPNESLLLHALFLRLPPL
jgi:DNA polymerase-3 subunit delta'